MFLHLFDDWFYRPQFFRTANRQISAVEDKGKLVIEAVVPGAKFVTEEATVVAKDGILSITIPKPETAGE